MATTLMSASASATAIAHAQQWTSTLRRYSLWLEHVAVDISTDRILYHLECELEQSIPPAHLAVCEFLSLGWPLGGIWKILKLGEDGRFVHCIAWRKTELNHEHIEEMNDELLSRQRAAVPDPPLTIFAWKMQLGTWQSRAHWFLRDALPPSPSTVTGASDASSTDGSATVTPPLPLDTPVHARLLVGLAPIQVYLNVNTITAVDTVAQTFTADVTWDVTLPGVTAIREDSVLRELLDLLEFNEDAFEFSNVTSVQEERAISTVLAFAGTAEFRDSLSPPSPSPVSLLPSQPVLSTAKLHDLTYSRRTLAVFSEEMSLYNFPCDQQKLAFAFSMGTGVRASLRVVPAPVVCGRFALEHFKLGNVFDVVYGDKVFVGSVVDEPRDDSRANVSAKKAITFELTLERRSGYYFTNVALPAAIITYLCFSTFAPVDETGELMDTSSRLQIVITLLLTAVTFKSQVAALIPQVSYFTALDRYVFFCFVVTCAVTLENALFPSLVRLFPAWREDGLLGFSVGVFSLVNVGWLAHLVFQLRLRAHRTHVLLQVEEFVRVVAATVPPSHRDAVLRTYLAECAYKRWELPAVACTPLTGVLHIELPDDAPRESKQRRARHGASDADRERLRKNAHRELPRIQQLYHALDPSAPATDPAALSCDALHDHHAARAGVAAVLARRASSSCFVVNMQDEADVMPLRQSAGHYRRQSQA